MPDTPATLPSVVAVGGTSLQLNSDGTRASETVWNGNGPGDAVGLSRRRAKGATGGGCSTLFTAPLWQQSAPGFAAAGCGTKRLAADVAAVGDPDTGFDVFDTYNCGPECKAYGIGSGSGWVTLGGTSLSTPLISSLYALAGGAGGVSDPALTLYGHLVRCLRAVRRHRRGQRLLRRRGPQRNATLRRGSGTSTAKGPARATPQPASTGPPASARRTGSPRSSRCSRPPSSPRRARSSPARARASAPANRAIRTPAARSRGYAWGWGDGSAGSDVGSPSSTHSFAGAGKLSRDARRHRQLRPDQRHRQPVGARHRCHARRRSVQAA